MIKNFINYIDQYCPFCGRLCNTTSAFTYHKKSCIKNPKSNAYKNANQIKICEKCGKEYVNINKKSRFCSRSCANSHVPTEEQKLRTKIKQPDKFCVICNKKVNEHNKSGFCRRCVGKRPVSKETREKLSNAMKGKPRWHIRRNQTSFAEKFWISVLENNNISFQREVPIKKDDNIHCYFLDFFIQKNNVNINLEIDGLQHKERIEHDIERDFFLRSKNIIVYRVEWNEIRSFNGKELIKNKINDFLLFLEDI